jgi:hypothetical protein
MTESNDSAEAREAAFENTIRLRRLAAGRVFGLLAVIFVIVSFIFGLRAYGLAHTGDPPVGFDRAARRASEDLPGIPDSLKLAVLAASAGFLVSVTTLLLTRRSATLILVFVCLTTLVLHLLILLPYLR